MDCRDSDMACEFFIKYYLRYDWVPTWGLFSAYAHELFINIMLCYWLKFKVHIQLFLSYGVYDVSVMIFKTVTLHRLTPQYLKNRFVSRNDKPFKISRNTSLQQKATPHAVSLTPVILRSFVARKSQ